MVHALHEAWRVLFPGGVLIDLRPISVDSPVDIIFNQSHEFVGNLDMSLGMQHDTAADLAIESVISDRLFKDIKIEFFELAYYWKTVRGMVADIRTRWKDDVILDETVVLRAYELFRMHRPLAQVRLLLQMKLARYEKLVKDQ
jgi:hypothetical protein